MPSHHGKFENDENSGPIRDTIKNEYPSAPRLEADLLSTEVSNLDLTGKSDDDMWYKLHIITDGLPSNIVQQSIVINYKIKSFVIIEAIIGEYLTHMMGDSMRLYRYIDGTKIREMRNMKTKMNKGDLYPSLFDDFLDHGVIYSPWMDFFSFDWIKFRLHHIKGRKPYVYRQSVYNVLNYIEVEIVEASKNIHKYKSSMDCYSASRQYAYQLFVKLKQLSKADANIVKHVVLLPYVDFKMIQTPLKSYFKELGHIFQKEDILYAHVPMLNDMYLGAISYNVGDFH